MKTLIIEIYKEPSHWKISAFYKGDTVGHRQYTVHAIRDDVTADIAADVFGILSRADTRGRVTDASLEELRKSARLLYDHVFPETIKAEIARTDAANLILHIDEELVAIPWELLHDGTDYLCIRFALGRVVLTSQRIHHDTGARKPGLNMLALCDPAGNLPSAYEEGIAVRNELDKARGLIRVDLATTDIDAGYVMKNLKEYDIFHFAGHAVYDPADSLQNGFILHDGILSSERIASLRGSARMPLLVFANACTSAGSGARRVEPEEGKKIYDLANSFLVMGVKYYIGTSWKVHDMLSMEFARIFYRYIRQGSAIGESLRCARNRMREQFGPTALIWASYLLYGDPEGALVPPARHSARRQARKLFFYSAASAAIVALLFGAFMLYSRLRIREEIPKTELAFKTYRHLFLVEKNKNTVPRARVTLFNQNIARGKPVRSSSSERNHYAARFAVDGNLSTRWSSEFSDSQWIYVDLEKVTRIGQIRLIWEAAFARSYEIQVSHDAERWNTVWRTSQGTLYDNIIDVRDRKVVGRYVKVYSKRRATDYGVSLFEFEVYPFESPVVSRYKNTYASSGDGMYRSSHAVDNDMGTRWGTPPVDPQFIVVDLEKRFKVNMITIHWEGAYGKVYTIEYSDDREKWIEACTVHHETNEKNINIYFTHPFFARYVRLYGIERATEYGYSLWEFEVHGMDEAYFR